MGRPPPTARNNRKLFVFYWEIVSVKDWGTSRRVARAVGDVIGEPPLKLTPRLTATGLP